MWSNGLYAEIGGRLIVALLIGGLVGMERSYHGRPAGFRTHTLVCIASALLMLVTVYESHWFDSAARATIDPTRMAQGIMTGIGFLGAGVIVKEGLSVRGLTTAASIWITAAIGVLVGVGFYFPAMFATLLTLGTLSVFRRIESKMPSQHYAHFTVRFRREAAMPEAELRTLIGEHQFTIANLNYQVADEGRYFEYAMVLQTQAQRNVRAFAEALNRLPAIMAFKIAPTGD